MIPNVDYYLIYVLLVKYFGNKKTTTLYVMVFRIAIFLNLENYFFRNFSIII